MQHAEYRQDSDGRRLGRLDADRLYTRILAHRCDYVLAAVCGTRGKRPRGLLCKNEFDLNQYVPYRLFSGKLVRKHLPRDNCTVRYRMVGATSVSPRSLEQLSQHSLAVNAHKSAAHCSSCRAHVPLTCAQIYVNGTKQYLYGDDCNARNQRTSPHWLHRHRQAVGRSHPLRGSGHDVNFEMLIAQFRF